MKTLHLTLFDGHSIIEDNGNTILIDTGAPGTIHVTNELRFMDSNFNASTDYMGLTAAALSNMLGTKVTTLLGTDILSRFYVLFDYAGNAVTFSTEEIPFEGDTVPLRNVMGVPILEIEINGVTQSCFLDTGAKISYTGEDTTEGLEDLGTVSDFYTGIGEFETSTYTLDAKIGNREFSATFGNLPLLLQMTLGLAGADGIIGYDLFRNFRVLINTGKGFMKID